MATEINLCTRGSMWKRLFATNLVAASANFVSGGLAAKPYLTPFAAGTNLALIDMREGGAPGAAICNSIIFRFFGNNANNLTFSARIWGIEEGSDNVITVATKSWEVTLLAQFLATLGNVNGVAGTLIAAADFEADTIATTYGATNDITLNSNATDVKQAWARLDNLGFPQIGVELDDGGSATSCNGLYRLLW